MMKRLIFLALVLTLTGCATPGMIDHGSWVADTRHPARQAWPRIKVLVIHYTAEDFDRSLTTLVGEQVSVHYLIPATPPLSGGKPVVWQLVPEQDLAWHAGASAWRGATRINDTSIGIELENQGYRQINGEKHYYPFPAAQIDALTRVAREIIARYGIAPQNVVAHGDIAPLRKEDPGPLFPWQQLAAAGIGAWPDASRVAFYLNGRPLNQPVDSHLLLDLLQRYGYTWPANATPAQLRRVISIFQMHFRPARYDGVADAQTQAIAEALLEKYGQG